MAEDLNQAVSGALAGDVKTNVPHRREGLNSHEGEHVLSQREQIASQQVFVKSPMAEAEVLNALISGLSRLDREARLRLLNTVATFFDLGTASRRSLASIEVNAIAERTSDRDTDFSSQPQLSPKDFLVQKEPKTDVERVACLAFYLTYYRDSPHFKTTAIMTLNREAAHSQFSNASAAVQNATQQGYLVAAGKGAKQMSAVGEQYVQALPDREAAKAVLARLKPRRSNTKKARDNKRDTTAKDNR